MPYLTFFKKTTRFEKGATLMETLVALAVLASIAVVFLGGLYITTKAAFLTDTRATAMSLAQSEIEYVQSANFTTSYTPASIPGTDDYSGYSVNITTASVPGGSASIQKITVTVEREGTNPVVLETYKVNR